MIKKRLLLRLAVLLVSAIPLASVEMEGLSVYGGILVHGNTVEEAAPVPVVPQIAFGAPIQFNPLIALEPKLTFYSLYFGYSDGIPQPVPVEKEWREVMVFNFLLDLTVQFGWAITPQLEIGAFVTPSFLFRLPGIAYDGKESYKESMAQYFYTQGRFFMPGGGGFLQWHFSDSLSMAFELKGLVPVHQLYGDPSTTLFDEMIISVQLGAVLHFGSYEKREITDLDADEILEDWESDQAEESESQDTE